MSATIGLTIRNAWLALPVWIRKFIVDAVEGSLAAVAVINLAFPAGLSDVRAQAILIVGAVASPILAAARRDLMPGLVEVLGYLFPAPDVAPPTAVDVTPA